jgi:hypothetical protein
MPRCLPPAARRDHGQVLLGKVTNSRAKRVTFTGEDYTIGKHTFRATGITAFRQNGGTLEQSQEIANHASPKTTMLYDRSRDQITLDAVERIVISHFHLFTTELIRPNSVF